MRAAAKTKRLARTKSTSLGVIERSRKGELSVLTKTTRTPSHPPRASTSPTSDSLLRTTFAAPSSACSGRRGCFLRTCCPVTCAYLKWKGHKEEARRRGSVGELGRRWRSRSSLAQVEKCWPLGSV